jgi:hypothetical protein
MNYRLIASITAVLLVSTALATPIAPSYALTDCTFTVVGTTMTLDNDCTTDATILIPDGFTLDGAGNTITAVDPILGHFVGAVVKNGGATADVNNLVVAASGLADVCDAGDDRLRGIMFEGASGSIVGNTVTNINQGASGCQEGNAIEVRNAPFDGTHPNTQTVEILGNVVTNYQKTGILANGDVSVVIRNNDVGSSATQADLAANSIQLGFGAEGVVKNNNISGNQWCGPSEFVATAVLVFDADGSDISQNNIRGNSDVGIYGFGDSLKINNNRVFDDASIADCNQFGYDIGIGDYGEDNSIINNKVRGFDTPYDPENLEDEDNNKVIPSN